MHDSLTGRTAIVTGANSGLGLEVARELAKRGADVVLACRDAGAAKRAADRVGGRPLPLDLASLASVREFASHWDGPLDVLVVPVGGGGLISGCATVARALAPAVRIVGVEPEASDDVARSLAVGSRQRVTVRPSIADGQLTPAPGVRTWPVIQALVDEVVTVEDAAIRTAMRFAFERVKLVVEPSGASGLAAVLAGRLGALADARVGVVLSGGNTGPEHLTAAADA